MDRENVDTARRGLLATILMTIGLVGGYGLGALHFVRYLIPSGGPKRRRQMFVGTLGTIPVGASMTVKDPRGQAITITRTANDVNNPAAGFRALSSKCPHLGCKVHWESANSRFFCPCHSGVFDPQGVAVSGPPAKEKKNLTTYEVKVDSKNGWVFVMVMPEFVYGA